MATAKKLPSGSWRCQVYDYTDKNGKRHYKSFTSTDQSTKGKREAERMAADYVAESPAKAIHTNRRGRENAAWSYPKGCCP